MTRLTTVFALFLSPLAFAQDVEPEPVETARVKYKARTELNFDGVELSASADKPGMALVTATRQGEFNPLIRLRADFGDEMKRSVDAMK